MVGTASPASHAATRSSGTPILRDAATSIRPHDSRAHRSTEVSTGAGMDGMVMMMHHTHPHRASMGTGSVGQRRVDRRNPDGGHPYAARALASTFVHRFYSERRE